MRSRHINCELTLGESPAPPRRAGRSKLLLRFVALSLSGYLERLDEQANVLVERPPRPLQ
jgi:hypothetical protein